MHVFVAAPCDGCARARPKRRIRAMGRVNDLASQGSQSARCSSALSRGKSDWMTGGHRHSGEVEAAGIGPAQLVDVPASAAAGA